MMNRQSLGVSFGGRLSAWPRGILTGFFKLVVVWMLVVQPLSLALNTGSAWAVNPDEVLSDPVLESRARSLSAGLRCMVCQNQSIDDSDAELARDLRVLVRERLQSGDTDEQVIDYIVARYGEYVLLKPRLGLRTYLLWGFPAAMLLFGVGFIWLNRRKAQSFSKAPVPLSEAEEIHLAQLMADDK